MKSFTGCGRLFWSIIVSIQWLTGCSDDISLVKPGNPIPVVYGVFDLNQPTQYIKLSKSFAGEEDATVLAQKRDLVFYRDAGVFLSDRSGNNRLPFHAESGIPRDPGFFPGLPNEVYVLNQKLQAGDYELTVILPTEKDTLKARFSFINPLKVIVPKAGFRRLYLYEDPMAFTWVTDPSAGLFEIAINLTYEEHLFNGDSRTDTAGFTRQIRIDELKSDNGRYTYEFYSDSFFARMGTGIRKDASVDYRKPVGLELLITAADTTLARYLNWYHLEIDDKANPNGNIQGAIGVVGTKSTVPFTGLVLSPRSQDSLVRGRYTKSLDFVNNPDW